ncbi:MAG: hypothetical protein HY020_25815 [Burkholderiales bacterium]|nr:hypothetical protein [Burkholderiales bacterium]
MKRFAILLACAAVAFGAQATPQQDKMKTCNAEAKEKDKKGDDRKAFMKECLAAKPAVAAAAPASPVCEKSAADKKLHGAAAKSHIKKCMADVASAPK